MVGVIAESIGLASGHPPAWIDTEDDGVGNRAGKVIGMSRSVPRASVPGDFGGCYGSLIGERTGRPDIPLAHGQSATPDPDSGRDSQREKPAREREQVSLLVAWPSADTGQRATVRDANLPVSRGAAKRFSRTLREGAQF